MGKRNNEKKYFYSDGEIQEREGIEFDELIWFQDLDKWTPASDVNELDEILSLISPPIYEEEAPLSMFSKSSSFEDLTREPDEVLFFADAHFLFFKNRSPLYTLASHTCQHTYQSSPKSAVLPAHTSKFIRNLFKSH